jgi:hypothetical protein
MGVGEPMMFGPESREIAASIRTSVKVMIVSVLQRAVMDFNDSHDK